MVQMQAEAVAQPVARGEARPSLLLAFDIGNTNIFFGVYRSADLIGTWRLETDPERAADWARHCLRAYFTRGTVDLANVEHVKALASEFGLDAAEAERVWSEPRWKSRLKTACDDAIAQGVFGAPFFVVDGEPFWGNDRRDQIERWLERGPF